MVSKTNTSSFTLGAAVAFTAGAALGGEAFTGAAFGGAAFTGAAYRKIEK